MKRIYLMALLLLTVSVSGCISSGNSSINQLSPQINDHIKKGDAYFNESALAANSFKLDEALSKCEFAEDEYLSARELASEALGHAKDTGDPIVVNYIELLVYELEAKLNATYKLKNAIQMFTLNDTESGNSNIELANGYMLSAKEFERKRQEIVNKNPEKFS